MTAVLDRQLGHAVIVDGTDHLDPIADRPEWLAGRRRGIGGSDAAAICGVSPYRDAFAVWLDKVSDRTDDLDNEPMEWGRRLEDLVAEVTAEREHVALYRAPALLAHPEHPWQLCSLDRLATRWVGDEPSHGIYEGKTASAYLADEWADTSVPERYQLQGQHYLAVTGLPWCLFGALIGGQRLVTRVMLRDDELIANLTAIERQFWFEHVLAGEPPRVGGSQATTELLTQMYDASPGLVVEVDPAEVVPLVEQYQAAHAVALAADAAKAEAGNRLRQILGDAEIAVADGEVLATWKTQHTRRLDQRLLRQVHTEIAEQCTTTTTERVLRTKKRKA